MKRLLDMLEPLVDDYAHDGVDAQGHELHCEVAQFRHFVPLYHITLQYLNLKHKTQLNNNNTRLGWGGLRKVYELLRLHHVNFEHVIMCK